MNHAYVITGGNTGNPAEQLATAARLLEEQCGRILDRSALYETEPWGKSDQPNFLNQVLLIETALSARQVLEAIGAIEKEIGRERRDKNGPRAIDVDILLFNHEVIAEAQLTVPHPGIASRRFVLVPLNEVAPAYIHPVTFQTVKQLLEACTDPLKVKKFVR